MWFKKKINVFSIALIISTLNLSPITTFALSGEHIFADVNNFEKVEITDQYYVDDSSADSADDIVFADNGDYYVSFSIGWPWTPKLIQKYDKNHNLIYRIFADSLNTDTSVVDGFFKMIPEDDNLVTLVNTSRNLILLKYDKYGSVIRSRDLNLDLYYKNTSTYSLIKTSSNEYLLSYVDRQYFDDIGSATFIKYIKFDKDFNTVSEKTIILNGSYDSKGFKTTLTELKNREIILTTSKPIEDYYGNYSGINVLRISKDGEILNSFLNGSKIINSMAVDDGYMIATETDITKYSFNDTLEFKHQINLDRGNYVYEGVKNIQAVKYEGIYYICYKGLYANNLSGNDTGTDILDKDGNVIGGWMHGYDNLGLYVDIYLDNNVFAYLIEKNDYEKNDFIIYMRDIKGLAFSKEGLLSKDNNMDVYASAENTLEMKLSTNHLNFSNYNGTYDLINDFQIKIDSSLNYDIDVKLDDEIRNINENDILINKNNLKIYDKSINEIKSFTDINTFMNLIENASYGKNKEHIISVKLIADSLVKKGSYETYLTFQAIQR